MRAVFPDWTQVRRRVRRQPKIGTSCRNIDHVERPWNIQNVPENSDERLWFPARDRGMSRSTTRTNKRQQRDDNGPPPQRALPSAHARRVAIGSVSSAE